MYNKGILFEEHFASFFNNRQYDQIFTKWKRHLKRMFPSIKNSDTVYCRRYQDAFTKPDLILEACGERKLLSLKSGKNPSVHQEYFKSFFEFLTSIGVSWETRATLSLYHFGTSRRLGITGTPLTKAEIVERFSDKIVKANEELNNPEIVKKVVERCIFQGVHQDKEGIDFFYYGSLEKGFLCDKEQIIESVLSRKEISSNFIHFGELVYQPSGRSRQSKDFLYSRIHWPILAWLYYTHKDENNFLIREEELH